MIDFRQDLRVGDWVKYRRSGERDLNDPCVRIEAVTPDGWVEIEGDGGEHVYRMDGSRPGKPAAYLRRCDGQRCLNARHAAERAAGAS